jgi:hypothetical protein
VGFGGFIAFYLVDTDVVLAISGGRKLRHVEIELILTVEVSEGMKGVNLVNERMRCSLKCCMSAAGSV